MLQCVGRSGLGGVEEALQAHTRKVCGGRRHKDGPHRHHELGGQGAGVYTDTFRLRPGLALTKSPVRCFL